MRGGLCKPGRCCGGLPQKSGGGVCRLRDLRPLRVLIHGSGGPDRDCLQPATLRISSALRKTGLHPGILSGLPLACSVTRFFGRAEVRCPTSVYTRNGRRLAARSKHFCFRTGKRRRPGQAAPGTTEFRFRMFPDQRESPEPGQRELPEPAAGSGRDCRSARAFR